MSNKSVRKLSAPLIGLNYPFKFFAMLTKFVMRHGKLSQATDLMNKICARCLLLLGKTPNDMAQIASDLEENMMIRIGFFKRRLGPKTHRIPYMMDDDRAYRHSLKSLYKIGSAQKGGSVKGIVNKLSSELAEVYLGKGKFIQKKKEVYNEG
jgi:ribosomal protein S7